MHTLILLNLTLHYVLQSIKPKGVIPMMCKWSLYLTTLCKSIQ